MGENLTTLVLAIILQAVKDFHFSTPYYASEAQKWLLEEGIHWCRIVGVSEDKLSKWKETNFELPPNSHRNWRY